MKLQWYCQNIEAFSGYSDEARVMIKGLENLKVSVTLVGSHRIKNPSHTHHSPAIDPSLPIVYHTYRHNSYQIKSRIHSMARTMLEVSRIPQSWVHRFKRMDEIWVPNLFNYHSFMASGVPEEKLFIIPSPVDLGDPEVINPFPVKSNKKFKFISIFNYQARERKGLDILIKTYRQTFAEKDNVCLIIKGKTSLRELDKEYDIGTAGPEVEVINQILTRDELLGLHKTADCFILPSRGEGIGRPFLDAMMMGTPIITTGWSGQADYLNQANAFLLNYKLVDVDTSHYLKFPGFYGSQWAEPEGDDLALKMREVINNPREAAARALQSRRDIASFAADKICSKVKLRLMESGRQKPSKTDSPASIFETLFPIYYPEISKSPGIQLRSRQDFNLQVNSLILTGHGHALKRAAHFFHSKLDINQLYFLDIGQVRQQPPAFLLQNRISMSQAAGSAPLVVIAAPAPDIADIYYTIINRIDSLPVYVFS